MSPRLGAVPKSGTSLSSKRRRSYGIRKDDKDRHTEDQREELLQEKEDYRATINELLQVKEATEKAL